MKIKIFLAAAFVVVLSGCSSAFTSIEPGEKADTYYITEVYARPFGVSSNLLLCEAEGVTKMVCESVD